MILKKYKLSFFVLKFLVVFLFFACESNDYKKSEMYTIEQCKKFKKGDTIYTRLFYSIEKQVVEKNDVNLNILELREVGFDWNRNIVEYDEIRFK